LKLVEIPRNDIDAAIAYAEEQLDADTFTTDDAHVLAMLQDDPSSYFEAFGSRMAERKARGATVPVGF
jgi:hypothetical protein